MSNPWPDECEPCQRGYETQASCWSCPTHGPMSDERPLADALQTITALRERVTELGSWVQAEKAFSDEKQAELVACANERDTLRKRVEELEEGLK